MNTHTQVGRTYIREVNGYYFEMMASISVYPKHTPIFPTDPSDDSKYPNIHHVINAFLNRNQPAGY